MTLFQLIDLRSFSTIWYWLMLGAVWTRVLHAPMGVPAEMVLRARRGQPAALSDLTALSGIRVRQEREAAAWNVWRVAGWSFVLSALAVAGYGYAVEVAQAGFLLLAPFALVRLIVGRCAARLDRERPEGAALVAAHLRLRRQVRLVVLPAVFLAAIWGMAHNIVSHSVLY